ncbi:PD-(D/E)XK nuclease family protein [uncultured Ilyobacter sp.]|uniref:PD-(D/E)XK nuclease family protein n=1 Tax=uncultured Ilyobacter sp. TaxID=544433 RepID=UPI0029F507AB|nr:PD-(D/E)XK nuclease family protein [uncultured Ilyobacter sp.]
MRDVRKDKNFLYTQSSIGTFIQCPLKFRYRYFEGLYGSDDDSLKDSFERGSRFHLLAERYFKGIDTEGEYIQEKELKELFQKIKEKYPLEANCRYFSEYEIREKTEKIRLMARYDLIILKPNGRVQIVDFKTNKRRLSGKSIEESLQTKIYLYLLKENYKYVFENIRKIKNIEMVYYQTEYSEENFVVKYDDDLHEKNRAFLNETLENIEVFNFNEYEKTEVNHCKVCEFKNFCWKNKKSVDDTLYL